MLYILLHLRNIAQENILIVTILNAFVMYNNFIMIDPHIEQSDN